MERLDDTFPKLPVLLCVPPWVSEKLGFIIVVEEILRRLRVACYMVYDGKGDIIGLMVSSCLRA